ncbi:dihydrolipoyl dehydrogenase [Desulfurivibrio dismutans]|uniref:dihydrolipoyl dehydrogenase n=1 Tax=Desulfurivibrio dismutans TaxID=1398908 RepID=UPI0023DC726D|nr:dihydrolipoyl dehydrogenase [Desulfurivibrio alkaliphilus]MDF1614377.1 dihydrolipoyl dehydrogenase [Desulfurivibrio alkaliphilus]
MQKKVDVVIIGAGSAGLSAVSEVKKKTDNFVLINQGHYGTSCARIACMPTKALVEAARACRVRHLLKEMGVGGTHGLTIDRRKIFEHVRRLRDGFTNGMIESTEKLGDRNITGRASFIDPETIEVEGRTIKTSRTIIATGSSSIVPSAWQELGDRIITSEEIFELTDLPDTMAVIGLGPTGLEMAQALARLGVRVIGVEQGETIGGLSDPEVSAAMVEILRREMTILTGVTAELAAAAGLEITIGNEKLPVAKALIAMGRRPNLQHLGLENLGLKIDDRGRIPCDPATMQVANLPVFIAGDADSNRPLLHEAIDEGRIAGYNSVRKQTECFQRRIPLAITFSEPDIVSVGRRYEQLGAHEELVVGSHDFAGQSRARMNNSDQGSIRIYGRRTDGLILGAEMAIPAGEHVGHLFAFAIQKKATVADLLRMPFYHPVIEEGVQSALRDLHNQTNQAGVSGIELLLCHSSK